MPELSAIGPSASNQSFYPRWKTAILVPCNSSAARARALACHSRACPAALPPTDILSQLRIPESRIEAAMEGASGLEAFFDMAS